MIYLPSTANDTVKQAQALVNDAEVRDARAEIEVARNSAEDMKKFESHEIISKLEVLRTLKV